MSKEEKKHKRDWFVNRFYRRVPILNLKKEGNDPFYMLDEEHANYLYLCQEEKGYRYKEGFSPSNQN